jgi:hypothetical protein
VNCFFFACTLIIFTAGDCSGTFRQALFNSLLPCELEKNIDDDYNAIFSTLEDPKVFYFSVVV